MLNFFKRKSATPSKPAASPRPRPLPAARSKPAGPTPEPPPLPDVSEGNLETDWALWEDSVAFQDSQMPSSYSELEAVKTRDRKPGKSSEPDPFAAVRKRGQ
jgi:hypothetical protein